MWRIVFKIFPYILHESDNYPRIEYSYDTISDKSYIFSEIFLIKVYVCFMSCPICLHHACHCYHIHLYNAMMRKNLYLFYLMCKDSLVQPDAFQYSSNIYNNQNDFNVSVNAEWEIEKMSGETDCSGKGLYSSSLDYL